MKIDSHHHFWNYDPADYGWIDDSMDQLRRDFTPANLKQEIDSVGIDGVVSVQARQSFEETEFLLDYGDANDFILGVVGWVPLRHANVQSQLDAVSERPKLKALRHVVQDEPDDSFLLGEDFNRGVKLLRDYGLAYDILIFEKHLPVATKFIDLHPDQTFILDHIAKPRIREKQLEPWRSNIIDIAKRPNVFCKFSGLVTEADHGAWTANDLLPYWETVLEAFGPQRLMFGSDWPVCLIASEYKRWFQIANRFAAELSQAEQSAFFGASAAKAYGVQIPN
ncbi:Amidohydrolase [Rubripirellula obstinata]|uniref:Amidohydrolase n=1 Tax=Rubripirellula obstinata TaxID=406547 RepID=A0A5B1CPB1_9BACT|nr:amidohydrolase family protein [Rubripirellula obstinata]KAA1261124.1 Amidohydrolase [Rubripirellula obstinata]